METGERFEDVELSTIDTALLIAGVLFASRTSMRTPEEAEIASLADTSTAPSSGRGRSRIRRSSTMGWTPEEGFLRHDWESAATTNR